MSVTQSLSTLRLTHARLLEEHGSNVALLHHREQELEASQTREAEAQDTIKDLRSEVRTLKDTVTRSNHKVSLAEREISFLQAMVVSSRRLRFGTCALSVLQASFNAEEAAHGDVNSEDERAQPLQELQALVKDYKATVAELEKQLKDARSTPVVVEDKEAKQELLAEIERERAAKVELEKRTSAAPTPSRALNVAHRAQGRRRRDRETLGEDRRARANPV